MEATSMRRLVLALSLALVLAIAGGGITYALYRSGRLTVDVSDGEGHGPDEGSPEWRSAAEHTIPARSIYAGAVIGLTTFCVVYGVLGSTRRSLS